MSALESSVGSSEARMLQPGKAVKVTIYLSEGSTHHGVPVYQSILDFLFYRGVAGATAMRGIAGFGADHHMHAAHLLEVSDKLPLKIEFIETQEKADSLLGKLQEMCGSGLIEIQETMVAKPASESKATKSTAPGTHLKIEGKAQMMRIYVNEEDKFRGKPLYKALVEAMRANDIAGVTVYRGILGHEASRASSKETQHGSVMLSAIDAEAKLKGFLPLMDEMVGEGLVVFSDVDILKYALEPSDASKESGR